MRKLHPRLGVVDVIEESPLFYRVSTTYDFWVPKAEFTPAPEKPVKKRKPKKLKRVKGNETCDARIESSIPPQTDLPKFIAGFYEMAQQADGAIGAYTYIEGDKFNGVVQFDDGAKLAKFIAHVHNLTGKRAPIQFHVKPLVN